MVVCLTIGVGPAGGSAAALLTFLIQQIMDGTIGIALLMVGAIALVIILLVMSHNRKVKQQQALRQDIFNRAATAANLSISQQEHFQERLLGLDDKQKMLVWFDSSETEQLVELIDLRGIIACNLIRATHKLKSSDNHSVVTGVHLQLDSAIGDKRSYMITFYDNVRNNQQEMPSLIKKAEQWQKSIKEIGDIK